MSPLNQILTWLKNCALLCIWHCLTQHICWVFFDLASSVYCKIWDNFLNMESVCSTFILGVNNQFLARSYNTWKFWTKVQHTVSVRQSMFVMLESTHCRYGDAWCCFMDMIYMRHYRFFIIIMNTTWNLTWASVVDILASVFEFFYLTISPQQQVKIHNFGGYEKLALTHNLVTGRHILKLGCKYVL